MDFVVLVVGTAKVRLLRGLYRTIAHVEVAAVLLVFVVMETSQNNTTRSSQTGLRYRIEM